MDINVAQEFKTENDVLEFFKDGGCMLNTDCHVVYISDVNGDGEFFGIMVAENVPDESCDMVEDACDWAYDNVPAPGTCAPDRMGFMEAPGCCFSKFCEYMLSNGDEFIAVRY